MARVINQNPITGLHLSAKPLKCGNDIGLGRFTVTKLNNRSIINTHGAGHLAGIFHILGHTGQRRRLRSL